MKTKIIPADSLQVVHRKTLKRFIKIGQYPPIGLRRIYKIMN